MRRRGDKARAGDRQEDSLAGRANEGGTGEVLGHAYKYRRTEVVVVLLEEQSGTCRGDSQINC